MIWFILLVKHKQIVPPYVLVTFFEYTASRSKKEGRRGLPWCFLFRVMSGPKFPDLALFLEWMETIWMAIHWSYTPDDNSKQGTAPRLILLQRIRVKIILQLGTMSPPGQLCGFHGGAGATHGVEPSEIASEAFRARFRDTCSVKFGESSQRFFGHVLETWWFLLVAFEGSQGICWICWAVLDVAPETHHGRLWNAGIKAPWFGRVKMCQTPCPLILLSSKSHIYKNRT